MSIFNIVEDVRAYPVRKSHRKNLSLQNVARVMSEIFGNVYMESDAAISSYGCLKRILVRIKDDSLLVETERTDCDEISALDTIKKYNEFLYKVTGYSSEERRKLLMKDVD